MKTLILFTLTSFLLSTNAIAKDNISPLPTNIRGLVPQHAVNKDKYPQYSTTDNTFNIAILPGDGGNGAFATGIIAEKLKNTDYDIIIGTSSGGLTTLFSYANDREALIKFTSNITADKILDSKIKIIALLFGNSFADNTPLKEYILSNITNGIIDKMAHRYKMNKRGYVMTTSIDTAESVFWDIGAIASLDKSYDYRRNLLTKILVSSSALPIIFPPEKFNVSYQGKVYYQTHIDGGVGTNEMIQPWMLPKNYHNVSNKNVYLIQTKEFVHDFPASENKIPNIAVSALGTTYTNTYYLYKTILGYWATQNNTKAYVNFIPQNSPLNFGGYDFSSKAITTQFNGGRKLVQENKLQWININK